MTNFIELAHLAGDHDRVVDPLRAVGRRMLRRLAVAPRDDVLEIARGTGGAALPYPDERFDVVLSTFGSPRAPRHELAAREIARVLRSGGRFGLADWTPLGAGGQLFTITAAHAPAPPPVASAPALWGDEGHVRKLFAGTGIELDFVRETVAWRFDSLPEAVEAFVSTLGPHVTAGDVLEPHGRWTTLRGEIGAWFERWNKASTHRVELGADYLVVLGHKRGC